MSTKAGQRYTAEFKAQAVELIGTGKPVPQIAEELWIGSNLRSLRRENALLKMENDIFKKAAVILGTRPLSSFGR